MPYSTYRQSPRKIKATMAHFQGERKKFFPIATEPNSTRRVIQSGKNKPFIRIQRNLDGTRHHYCPKMYATSEHIKDLIYPKEKTVYCGNAITNGNYHDLCDTARRVRHERYAHKS